MTQLGHLQQIKLSGFRSIKELTLELAPLNVLIGANGAGKSNFISFFKFMNKLVEKELQLHVRTKLNGANRTLHFGRKTTSQLKIELLYGAIRYSAALVPTNDDSLVFASEHLQLRGPDNHWSDTAPSLSVAAALESGLPKPGGSSLQQIAAKRMSDWKVYHFHDTSDTAMLKSAYSVHATERLLPQGENLAAFLYGMRDTENYRRIVQTIQRVAPFFHDFLFQPEPNDLIRLRWKHTLL